MDMAPEDEHNARLRGNTHPLDWHNPPPRYPYNLAVIGAGTAGLITAAGAATMGARVALIEKHPMGVDVCLGEGRFTGPGTVDVGGTSLTFAKAVIATGSRPAVPSVPGLEDAGYMTNETVFNVTARPARLGVIGGGPIGCELAQTFQRLGSQVVLFHRGAYVLHKEDADAAEMVQQALRHDSVQLLLDTTLLAVEPRGDAKGLRFRNGVGETAGELSG